MMHATSLWQLLDHHKILAKHCGVPCQECPTPYTEQTKRAQLSLQAQQRPCQVSISWRQNSSPTWLAGKLTSSKMLKLDVHGKLNETRRNETVD